LPETAEERLCSLLAVPLAVQGRTIGAMNVQTVAPHDFAADEVELLAVIANLAAGALEKAALHDRMQQQIRELEGLVTVSRTVTSPLYLDEVLGIVAEMAAHVMGTAAVTALDLLDDAVNWLGERLVVGLDCSDGMVATHGWQQRSQMSAVRFTRLLDQHGVKRVVYTDTARDGMLGGPNLIGLRDLAEATSLEIILAGGIALLDDLRRLKKIDAPNVVGVIIGRALYEKSITLAAAKALLDS